MDDYKKKYEDAMARLELVVRTGLKLDPEYIFPELRESEDERIRKGLIKALKTSKTVGELKFILPESTREKCLAYLEKQKEQKPNYCHHEVDETGWTEEYRKAYYDGWNNCNMQHSQLKAEQKPTDNTAYPDCINDSWDNEYMINTIIGHYALHAQVLKKRGDDQGYNLEKEMENWLREIVKPLVLKEQKPVISDEAIRDGVVHFGITQYQIDNWLKKHINVIEQKPAEKQDYSGLNELERAVHRGFLTAGMENVPVTIIKETAQECLAQMKPAEWSENTMDEFTRNIRNLIIDKLTIHTKGLDGSEVSSTVFIDDKTAKDIASGILFYVGKEAMKNPNREIPEWSEEDEKDIAHIVRILDDCYIYGRHDLCEIERENLMKTLKFLRPSWKPSEDEERLINTSISFLKDFADKGYENAVECIDWLKSKLNGTSTDAK